MPPLRPALVERLKREHRALTVIFNGGIRDTETAQRRLAWADGVMVGRGAYRNPQWLSQLNATLFCDRALQADETLEGYLSYIEQELRRGVALHDMTRHLLTLFNGRRGARRYRRHLAAHHRHPAAGIDTLLAAAACLADGRPQRAAA